MNVCCCTRASKHEIHEWSRHWWMCSPTVALYPGSKTRKYVLHSFWWHLACQLFSPQYSQVFSFPNNRNELPCLRCTIEGCFCTRCPFRRLCSQSQVITEGVNFLAKMYSCKQSFHLFPLWLFPWRVGCDVVYMQIKLKRFLPYSTILFSRKTPIHRVTMAQKTKF